MQIAGTLFQNHEYSRSGLGPENLYCISKKIPGDADTAGLGITLSEPPLELKINSQEFSCLLA